MSERGSELRWTDPETGREWSVAVTGGRFGKRPVGEVRVSFTSDDGHYHVYAEIGPDELPDLSEEDLTRLLHEARSRTPE